MADTDFTVQIDWSHDDAAFAAVFLRDGQPWFLDGALVGMGQTREAAVTDLTGAARYLILNGYNYCVSLVPDGDRQWLFNVLGQGCTPPDGELRLMADRFTPRPVTP